MMNNYNSIGSESIDFYPKALFQGGGNDDYSVSQRSYEVFNDTSSFADRNTKW